MQVPEYQAWATVKFAVCQQDIMGSKKFDS